VLVDCRVPPRFGEDHVRGRITELLGTEAEAGYRLHFEENVVGNISPLEGQLAEAIDSFIQGNDPGAAIAPMVLSGFTDSHWFRKAFPECIAYGFFPQRAMTLFETTPLVHAPDERIAVDDLVFASGFYYELPQKLLG
jgi:acetylornithine deacetylase/succinyl-diaminopimelate desuccinylase-like protein